MRFLGKLGMTQWSCRSSFEDLETYDGYCMTKKMKTKEKKTMSKKPVDPCKFVTGKNARLSYEHVFEPSSVNGGTPRYSACVLFPKTDTEAEKRARAAVEEAYRAGESTLKGNGKTLPPMAAIKLPIRDGDLERPDDPAYRGCWFVNAGSVRPPVVVDAEKKNITDASEIYSGCYVRVSMHFYAFNTNGNRGIACGLDGVQKIRDGEPLGSRCNVNVDFADDDDESDEDYLS